MKLSNKLALAAVAGLAFGSSVITGCAADRPIRNGVPNEELFLRKAFIIRSGVDSTAANPTEDDGWMLKATVMQTSTPNPLASSVLFTGAENNGMMVRFVVTQDQLQMLDLKELSTDPAIAGQETRTPAVINTWPAENGDLKLAVTADGEKTNEFQENQELDWHVRQWVRVNLAKSDLSDWALFGPNFSQILAKCVSGGASTTVQPDSIFVDEPHDYMEWKVNVTLPINTTDETCTQMYGEAGQDFARVGRQNVTAVVKYSMTRAVPTSKITYQPLELAEKDPIRRKYGAIMQTNWARDPDSGQLAARELSVRFDPTKDITLYFAKGYPEANKAIFTGPGGIVDQTNAIFAKAGSNQHLIVKNFDQDIPADAADFEKQRGREAGDVRYNFIRWQSDLDTGAPFIGVTQFVPDPRTGETLSASINIADFPLKEYVAQRVDAFLQTVMCNSSTQQNINGVLTTVCANLNSDGPWGPPMTEQTVTNPDGTTTTNLVALPDSCNTGDTAPLVPSTIRETYGKSSLYSKMQEYMGRPVAQLGPLGPQDFVVPQEQDFHDAYYRLIPYYIFADPATNQFVTPVGDGGEFGIVEQFNSMTNEVAFHKLTGAIDQGTPPYNEDVGQGFVQQAATWLNNMQQGQINHRDMLYKQRFLRGTQQKADSAGDLVSFIGVMQKAGRHCVNGAWETKEQWLDSLTQSYDALTVWHEFGHFLGLEHNFMASVDQPNYPHYTQQDCDKTKDPTQCDRVGMYASSVMEYSATPDRIFWANESGGPGWAPYDRGALAWLYGNKATLPQAQIDAAADAAKQTPPDGPSGQVSPTLPYNDPLGWDANGQELKFLYCNENHTRFTPTCRSFDFGATPSEIIANEIENYEWQYNWRNFRKYRKVWDISNYADIPSQEIIELRRFLPMWSQDWNSDAIIDDFARFGVKMPAGASSAQLYFNQLAEKFDDEMSGTAQMVAAFHLAVIQQSSGERPFQTIIDKFSGDVTQQGITLDKQFAMQGWVGLWPQDNYDPNERGAFISSFSGAFDQQYLSVAQKAAASMTGEDIFDSFPYLKSAAVVQFAKDTHDLNFPGQIEVQDWVGSQVFTREQDYLDFFRDIAVKAGGLNDSADGAIKGCVDTSPAANGKATIATCTYNPTLKRVTPDQTYYTDPFNEFTTPDGRRWIWVHLADRNQYAFVDRDRNTVTYKIFRDYTTDVIYNNDTTDTAYTYQRPVKYFIDAFQTYANPGK